MTYDPVSQDAIPFPRRAVGDSIKTMVGGWTLELAHLVKYFCGNMRTRVLVPASIQKKLGMVAHVSNSHAE